MQFSPSSLRIVPLFKPDLVLVQTKELEKKFRRQSCNVEFLPCGGVDLDRHRENREGKILLKEKYGIDRDKFVILHVGSIKRSRNVQSLTKLQTDENQVVIVGSTSVGVEMELYHQLERSGCLVLLQYIERIEEVYALADCYVFPVVPKKNLLESAKVACIDIPLSVLEAMAHNLPVVSTKFGALPDIFEEGNGLFFVEREEEFISALNKVKSCKDVRTREKVEAYSWGNIAKRLEQVYSKLIGGEIGR
ncbi:MAG: glycosyltransferase family 4 protein [Archaeoglobaceae archaeon]